MGGAFRLPGVARGERPRIPATDSEQRSRLLGDWTDGEDDGEDSNGVDGQTRGRADPEAIGPYLPNHKKSSRRKRRCGCFRSRCCLIFLAVTVAIFCGAWIYRSHVESAVRQSWTPDAETQRFSQRPLPPPPEHIQMSNYTLPLRTKGRNIIDASGRRFKLASVNWYGASDELFVPGGLDIQHRDAIAQTIRSLGFNSVRLPYADEMVMKNPTADARHLRANPDLVGLRAMDIFHAIVESLTKAGIAVIVNNHITSSTWCCGADPCDAAWENDYLGPFCRVKQTEEEWIQHWEAIMLPHVNNPLVIGVDLRNEIRGLWGTMPWSKWAPAAEKCGNRLLKMNKDWLVIIEGTESSNDLSHVGDRPIQLDVDHRVVYSAHVYAWSGWGSWEGRFLQREYESFAETMRHNWAYILEKEIAPVWVGEFGAPARPSVGDANYWQHLMRFLREQEADFGYWALNARKPRGNTTESYGLVQDDWFGDRAKGAIRDRERVAQGQPHLNVEEPFTWPTASDDDDDADASIYRLVPSMQKFRNNLTALSQAYNLYFVAYQGHIFVYRPRTVPGQALPRRSDLQLKPKASHVASHIGGHLDHRRPHLINHLITGFLGNDEIVLACYDDGDVVGYYIRGIAECVFGGGGTAGSSHRAVPRFFFHENVGMSAWGLAIHQKSRLIAVSSNRHEVVVFALALTPKRPRQRANACQSPQKLREADESNVNRRACNWRIVILLGLGADNVPNICFVDDADGEAQRVCAIDIKGTAWLANIWQPNSGPITIPPCCHPPLKSEEFFPAPSRGWGIFALDESNFMKVKTTEELFGLTTNRLELVHTSAGCRTPMVNLRKAPYHIPDNPHRRAAPPALIQFDPQFLQAAMDAGEPEMLDVDISEGEAEDELEDTESGSDGNSDGAEEDDQDNTDNATTSTGTNTGEAAGPILIAQMTASEINTFLGGFDAGSSDSETCSHEDARKLASQSLDMTYFPHNDKKSPTPRSCRQLLGHLQRPSDHNWHPKEPESKLAALGRKLFLLRTYEKDVELRTFSQLSEDDPVEFGVICPDVLNFGLFRDATLRQHFHATSRLNMIALAPELSLMAIGSPTGRVVLLTLTRKAVPTEHEEGIWEHGFRVEWVLPTRSDEEVHRRVLRPMHGMAMGPVQVDDGVGGEVGSGGPAMPRRYRLMLHYRNHDILSYELTRENQTGKLCIF
ncbi:hypothetical protein FDECE_7002 [Fusarium decemcellulare]|nr:hypothetical protein FDECE_7002 [Fusarium decemcellulare]